MSNALPLLGIDGDDKMQMTIEPAIHHSIAKIKFDKSKPNGTPRKIIDNSLALSYGWKSKISLDEGFKLTLESYKSKSLK